MAPADRVPLWGGGGKVKSAPAQDIFDTPIRRPAIVRRKPGYYAARQAEKRYRERAEAVRQSCCA